MSASWGLLGLGGLLAMPPYKGKILPRVFSDSKVSSAGTASYDELEIVIPYAAIITRSEIDITNKTDLFNVVDVYVECPKGGTVIRLCSGHALPTVDGRLIENHCIPVQPNSVVRAFFHGINTGQDLWLQIAVLEV